MLQHATDVINSFADETMLVHPEGEQQAIMMKVLLLGESNVGKTSLVTRYTSDKFDAENNLLTLGIDTRKLNKICQDKHILLQLWDTAGQERYKTIPTQYFKGIQGAILVYDITDEESFLRIQNWLEKIEENTSLNEVVIILVGNKLDLAHTREVNSSESAHFAESKGMHKLQTSAKESTNVDEMFEVLMSSILEKGIKCSRRQIRLDSSQCTKRKEDTCCN